jgi:hypothetical protein
MGCLLLGRNPMRRRPRTNLSSASLSMSHRNPAPVPDILPYTSMPCLNIFCLIDECESEGLSVRLPCRGSKDASARCRFRWTPFKAFSTAGAVVLAGNLVGTDVVN